MAGWAACLRELAQRWGWLALLAFAPLFVFITPATTPVLLVVPALLAALWVGGRPDCPWRTPLDGALLLLAVMILVSLWATFSIEFSLGKIAGLVLGLGLFQAVAAAGRRSPRMFGWQVATFLALGLGVAALGLVGMRVGDKLPGLAALLARLPRVLVSLPGAPDGLQPNEVAGVLLWVAPVALAVSAGAWQSTGAGGRRWLARGASAAAGLAGLALLGVMVLSQSRSGLLGLAAGLAAMLYLALWSGRRWLAAALAPGRRRLWLLAATLAAVALLSGAGLRYWQPLAASVRQALAPSGADPASSNLLTSLDARVEIWSRAIYGIEDFPFTGMGLNTFRKLLFVLYPPFSVSPDAVLGHAHNTWLQVALDLGLPGLVAYLAAWLATGTMLLQSLQVGRDARGGPSSLGIRRLPSHLPPPPGAGILQGDSSALTHAMAVGILGALAGSLVFGLTDTVALGARPGFLWWMMLGLAVVAWHHATGQDIRRPGMMMSFETSDGEARP